MGTVSWDAKGILLVNYPKNGPSGPVETKNKGKKTRPNEKEGFVSSRQHASYKTVRVLAKIHELMFEVSAYTLFTLLGPLDSNFFTFHKKFFVGKKYRFDSNLDQSAY